MNTYIALRPEKSRKADRTQLNKWLSHPLGSIPLKDVSQYDAYDFFEELGEALTKSSIGLLPAALSNIYKWANKQRDLGITLNDKIIPLFRVTFRLVSKTPQTLAFAEVRLAKIAVFEAPQNVRKAYANGMQSVWHVYSTFGIAVTLSFDATPLPSWLKFGVIWPPFFHPGKSICGVQTKKPALGGRRLCNF
ncbi:MAG: hypothetical protein QNK92_16900 [Amylibacter sp.]